MNNLFYSENLSKNTPFTLSSSESKHILHSLRMKIEDQIHVTDGLGNLYLCRIVDTKKANVTAYFIKDIKYKMLRSYRLHIAISPTHQTSRFDWFIEKSTEIGIDKITPLICKRTVKKNVSLERMKKIIASAAKQSLNPFFPKIETPHNFNDFVSLTQDKEGKYIAHCEKANKQTKVDIHPKEVIILIGPEGDFSKEEIKQSIQNGYKPLSLGSSRLRTETAGVVACTMVAQNFL